MEKKQVLIVVDMQNDFIDGALGTAEAQAIVPKVLDRIEFYKANGWDIYFTQDTHTHSYLDTVEGKHLPIKHCIRDTVGWQIHKSLRPFVVPYVIGEHDSDCNVITKANFGYNGWVLWDDFDNAEIQICGLCTDICVISNALILKAEFPDAEIFVDPELCAGTTPAKHDAAIEVMKSCQINILEQELRLNV